MKLPEIIIYTDGSSRGNPGPGGWGSIVATNERVVELGKGDRHTTNNKMELIAAIEALLFVRDLGDSFQIDVRADSSYVINGITKWVFGWQKNGWMNSKKEEVLNRDLWEMLAQVVADLSMSGSHIKWTYTPGHAGIPGNERADEIATLCADGLSVDLYDGLRGEYQIDLVSQKVVAEKIEKKRTKTSSSAKAYSYLSLIDGVFKRHETWAECEKRVKGAKGAKFKKSISAEDERMIMKAWNV